MTLWREVKDKNIRSFDFIWQMPEMFLKPFVQHRARTSARLPEPTVKAMNHVLGVKTTQVDTNSERKPKKCSHA